MLKWMNKNMKKKMNKKYLYLYTLPVFYSVDYGFDISKLYKISSTVEFKSKASFV